MGQLLAEVLAVAVGLPAAVFCLIVYIHRRQAKRAEAKIGNWLRLLGYNVTRLTKKDHPRPHLLKTILLRTKDLGDHGCNCGHFQVALSEVVPASGSAGLVRVVDLGYVCPRCGRTEIPGSAWEKRASFLGSRMVDESNFFSLIEILINEEAEKAGSSPTDDTTRIAVPARTAS